MRAIFQVAWVRKLTGKPVFLTITHRESEARRIHCDDNTDLTLHSTESQVFRNLPNRPSFSSLPSVNPLIFPVFARGLHCFRYLLLILFCRPVGPRQDHARHAVNELEFVEVDDQTEGNIQQFHVAQQLGLMDWQYLLNTLKLKQQTTLDQNVKSQRFIKDQTLVLDLDKTLIDCGDFAQLEFAHQTPFIDAFNQTRSFQAMNLDGRANDEAAQLISLLEKNMHSDFVHQANEANKELCLAPHEILPPKSNLAGQWRSAITHNAAAWGSWT